MAGMLTGDRSVRLEVAGMCQQSISHTSNYTITVPYGSMSSTMQSISRMGGKVVGVQFSDVTAAAASAEASAPKKGRKQ